MKFLQKAGEENIDTLLVVHEGKEYTTEMHFSAVKPVINLLKEIWTSTQKT